MSFKDNDIDKLYYSIGEIATMFNVNASLIRYWESEFKELQVRKDRNGTRLFTKSDIETLKIIYALVKEKGFTIDGAKAQLKNLKEEKKKLIYIEKLNRIKDFLEEVKGRI